MNILLLLVIAVTVGAVVFGVMTLVTGGDPGLKPAEPDTRARPLPSDRPLVEGDIGRVTFDKAWRGYRMDQTDQTLRRLAYDIGYKSELIDVLEAEIVALREGRVEDADNLARTRAAALSSRQPTGEAKPEIELVTAVAPESAPIDLDEPSHEPFHESEPDEETDAQALEGKPDTKSESVS
ncbi:MAG TPA: DivIVA domain-containing protein [Candidatus Limnocylindrales bacterium]